MNRIDSMETLKKIKDNGAFFKIERINHIRDAEYIVDNFEFIDSLYQMALAGKSDGNIIILQPKDMLYGLLQNDTNNFTLKNSLLWNINFFDYSNNTESIVKCFPMSKKNIAIGHAFDKILLDIYANEFGGSRKSPYSTIFICCEEDEKVRLNAILEGRKKNSIDVDYRMAINPQIFNACNKFDLSNYIPLEQ